MKNYEKTESWYIKSICLFFSISFFLASFAAASYLDVWHRLLKDWYTILISPAPLVTDYFQLGNLASAFFNTATCGMACTLLTIATYQNHK